MKPNPMYVDHRMLHFRIILWYSLFVGGSPFKVVYKLLVWDPMLKASDTSGSVVIAELSNTIDQ